MKLGRIASFELPFDVVVFLAVLPGKLTVWRPTLAERREGRCAYAVVTVPNDRLPEEPWPAYVYRGLSRPGGTDIVISPASLPRGPVYYGDAVDDVINELKGPAQEVQRLGERGDGRNAEFVEEAYAALCGDPGLSVRDMATRVDDWLDNAYNKPAEVFDLMRRMQEIYQYLR